MLRNRWTVVQLVLVTKLTGELNRPVLCAEIMHQSLHLVLSFFIFYFSCSSIVHIVHFQYRPFSICYYRHGKCDAAEFDYWYFVKYMTFNGTGVFAGKNVNIWLDAVRTY